MKRLRRPSPAMVISLAALFFSLSGVSYGLIITGHSIKNGTVTGADIRNHSLASRDVKHNGLGGAAILESRLGPVPASGTSEGLARQAVVTGAGVLARGRGVTSASRTGQGRYQVIFNRDVRGCAYVASICDAGAAAPAAGLVETSQLASNVNGVSLRTQNSNGTPNDRPFHLIVSC
jgi:hypothetical protein